MLTSEQLEARRIGGSDIGIILGLNPYRMPIDLYREKIGEAQPFQGNEHTQAGEVMEGAIADLYELRTGRPVRRSNLTHVHKEHDFLTAHIDRIAVGERRIIEIKNIGRNGARAWGDSGTDQVPAHYLAQVHHYMLVLDYPSADIVAYFGGGDLGIYPVARSAEWDALIVEKARAFWQCVQTRTPPEFDAAHPAALDTIKRLHPGTDGTTIAGDDMLMYWAAVEQDAVKSAARYDTIAEGARAHILAAMGDAAVMNLPDGGSYTRKMVKRGAYQVEATEYMQLRYKKAKE